jgi:RNA polymerase sigma-70 factor (ECF subfamily)
MSISENNLEKQSIPKDADSPFSLKDMIMAQSSSSMTSLPSKQIIALQSAVERVSTMSEKDRDMFISEQEPVIDQFDRDWKIKLINGFEQVFHERSLERLYYTTDIAIPLGYMRHLLEDYFEAIVKMYSPYMLALAMRILGDIEAAKDITQDSLFKMWCRWMHDQYYHDVMVRSYRRAWFCVLVRNMALDYVRRSQLQKTVSLDLLDLNGIGISEPQSLEEVVSQREDVRLLYQLVDHLPAHYKIVLYCLYIVGMTGPEVAQNLGISLNTVRSRAARGRSLLRKMYLS